MSEDYLTPADLADQALEIEGTSASKTILGKRMLDLIAEHDEAHINSWRHARLVASMGAFVSQHKARLIQDEAPKVSYQGVPMTGGISVGSSNSSRQMALWLDVSPQEFIDAVQREQNVVDGRSASNRVRLQIMQIVTADEELSQLPTLRAVLDALEIDPNELNLDELAS